MKRHALKLTGLSLLLIGSALATSASAQSNVTVYGKLDLFVEFGKGDVSKVSLESGGLSGSRLGFKGVEDLGGGLNALYQIEMGINADTGTSGQGGLAFGRQAFVGLSGGFGSLTFGRQYVPHFIGLTTTDPFDTGLGSAASSGIVSVFSRANNSIVYNAPKLGDLSLSAMYALGESPTGSSSNGDLTSVDLRYAAGAFNVGVALSRLNRPTPADENTTLVLLSGGYDFGAFRLTGGVQSVDAAQDRTEYYIGGLLPMGATTFTAGLGSGKTKGVDGSRATQYSLGVDHALSKRTDLYAVATHISNGTLTAYTPGGATGGGNFTVSPGRNASALQIGMRHAF